MTHRGGRAEWADTVIGTCRTCGNPLRLDSVSADESYLECPSCGFAYCGLHTVERDGEEWCRECAADADADDAES